MWYKNNNLKLSISKINEVVVNYGASKRMVQIQMGVLHVHMFQQQRFCTLCCCRSTFRHFCQILSKDCVILFFLVFVK